MYAYRQMLNLRERDRQQEYTTREEKVADLERAEEIYLTNQAMSVNDMKKGIRLNLSQLVRNRGRKMHDAMNRAYNELYIQRDRFLKNFALHINKLY